MARLTRNAVAVTLAMLALPATAAADTFTVTSSQEGAGSLRQAIADANAHPGHDVIDFAPAVSKLTMVIDVVHNGPLEITGDVEIDGPGADSLKLFAFGTPVIRATASASATINDLHIFGSSPISGGSTSGGAIQNEGALTLRGVLIDECHGSAPAGGQASGGAVSNTGTMTIRDSTLTHNGVGGSDGGSAAGGAIANSGSLKIDNTQLINNTAAGANGASHPPGDGTGGAISNTGTLEITDSTLAKNIARGGSLHGDGGAGVGGAIYNAGSGSLTIRNSTLSDNTASGGGTLDGSVAGLGIGGAIENTDTASLRVENSTISSNAAAPGPGTHADTQSFGGGIDNQAHNPGNATIVSTTIAGNVARRGANLDADGALSLKSSILTDPRNGNGGAGDNCHAVVDSQGYNIASDDSCKLRKAGDQESTDPKLGALKDNGGPTETMAIGTSSPALDQGVDSGIDNDQRGSKRPVVFAEIPQPAGGDGSDVGAYELKSAPGELPRNIDGTARRDEVVAGERACVAFKARKADDDGDSAGPLRDVTVRFAGEEAETGRDGKARICGRFESAGVRRAVLTKTGYESDRIRIGVVEP